MVYLVRVWFCEEEYTVEFIFCILMMILSYVPVFYYAQFSTKDESSPVCYSAEEEKDKLFCKILFPFSI